MSQKIKALTAIPAVPDRTRDPQTTFNAKTVAWMEAQKRNTDDFNANVPALNELFTKADQALDAAEEAVASAATATQKAGEASVSAATALEAKDAAQTARTGAEAAQAAAEDARDAAQAVADVGIATTSKAGLVKPDGVTLKLKDSAGKVVVKDVIAGSDATDTAKERGQIGDCYSIPKSGVDFNTLTKSGRYWFSNAALAASTNKPPTNTGGFCDVLGEEGSQNYTKQIYHVYNSPIILIREHKGTTQGWSETWTQIITGKDLATSTRPGIMRPGTGLAVKNGVVSVAGAGVKTLKLTEAYHVLASDPHTLVVKGINSEQELYMPDPASLSGNGTTYTIIVQPGGTISLRDHKGYSIGPDLVANKAYNVMLIDAENGIWARTEFAAAGVQQAGGGNLGYNLSISEPTVFWTDASNTNFKVIELSQRKYLLVQPDSSTTTALVMSADADGQLTTGEPITFASFDYYTSYEYLVLSDSLVIIKSLESGPYTTLFRALSISGTAVSAGEICAFAEGNQYAIYGTMEKMDASHFVLVWNNYDTNTSAYSGKAALFTVSGGNITAGEETALVDNGISAESLCNIDDGKTLLFYTASGGKFFSVLELSSSGGLVIHDPSSVTLSESLSSSRLLYLNENILLLTHSSATDYARIVTIADDFSVTVNSEKSISDFNLVSASVVKVTGTDNVIFVSSTSAVRLRISTGGNLNFGSVTQINSSATLLMDNSVCISDGYVLLGYTNSKRSSASFSLRNYNLDQKDTISPPGGLTFYNMQTFTLGNGKAIVFYRDTKNANYKTAQIITV